MFIAKHKNLNFSDVGFFDRNFVRFCHFFVNFVSIVILRSCVEIKKNKYVIMILIFMRVLHRNSDWWLSFNSGGEEGQHVMDEATIMR